MKTNNKLFILLAFLFFAHTAYSQHIGIGTTNPQHDLDIKGSTAIQYLYPSFGNDSVYKFLRIGEPGDYWGGLMYNISSPYYGSGDNITLFTYGNRDIAMRAGTGDIVLHPTGSGNVLLSPTGNGKIGVGTANPQYQLDIKGTTSMQYLYPSFGNDTIYKFIRIGEPSNYWAGIMYNVSSPSYGEGDNLSIFTYGSRDITMRAGSGNIVLHPTGNGNVGIGTGTPDYKLDVYGGIRALEVLVESGWSDHVFLPEYELKSLEQEAQFIEQNGHLSGFDSEADMEGLINMEDVTNKQQVKIEEMMLHMIQLNEEIKALKAKIEELEK